MSLAGAAIAHSWDTILGVVVVVLAVGVVGVVVAIMVVVVVLAVWFVGVVGALVEEWVGLVVVLVVGLVVA